MDIIQDISLPIRFTCSDFFHLIYMLSPFFTFLGPCIVNINVFEYNQKYATLNNVIYYYKCSTSFRRFLRPSSGGQNCIHSIGYLFQLTYDSGKKHNKLDKYPIVCIQVCAPVDARRNRLKHVEHLQL
jgi:hypothetical protein